MIDLIGYDDFGKEIRFNLSQIKDFNWKKRYMSIQTDELDIIDPDTIVSAEVISLREQNQILQTKNKKILDEIRNHLNSEARQFQSGNMVGYEYFDVHNILDEIEEEYG